MVIDEVTDLFAYDRWANLRVLDACAALPEEALQRDMGSSFPSVLATLAHVVSAEWVWLERWNGRSPAGVPPEWDLSSLAAVRSRWLEVEADRTAFVESLDDDRLRTTLEYRNTRGDAFAAPLSQLVRHVVNHSTYHRGQVTTMLRQFGYPAVATDLVLYHRMGAPGASPRPS